MFRETLSRGLSRDPLIKVVATAPDPYVARDKILEFEPDVMTLDVEMPRMNGIEFLRRLMPQYPIPVVMISGYSDNVFEALKAGAVDFVAKPDPGHSKTMDAMINELIVKIKAASMARLEHWGKHTDMFQPAPGSKAKTSSKIVAIGASTGGTEAILQIIKAFPKEMPGILVVQHMPFGFTRMYAERLDKLCSLEVKEAQNGDSIEPGSVLIAPGDQQMRLVKSGSGYKVDCQAGERVNGHSPSVDVLFNSVSDVAGSKAIGVILTGMGSDGAQGLLAMRKKGARTFGQDEESCIVYGMPRVAFELGAVEKQLPLEGIPRAVLACLNQD
ncbi:MAG: protein-glutamate methylesterase/protein-glutamine glutaminase [Ignavibacteriales bacterium]